jgi:hypothetical protein
MDVIGRRYGGNHHQGWTKTPVIGPLLYHSAVVLGSVNFWVVWIFGQSQSVSSMRDDGWSRVQLDKMCMVEIWAGVATALTWMNDMQGIAGNPERIGGGSEERQRERASL